MPASAPEPQVLRHRSPALRYDLVRAPGDPRLHGLVRSLWGFEERSTRPVLRRELPSGAGVVILDLGDGWRIAGPGEPPERARRRGSFASGLHDRPAFSEHAGRATSLQVDLTPLGVRALLGVPAGELAGIVVELDELLGPDAARLVERVRAARGWPARFALLSDALAARAAAAASPPRADVVLAWTRLEATGGGVTVESLARELGCSRRHLARRFAHDVGLPPKALARVLRFRRASGLLLDRQGPPIAEVAAACGFSDQAHLTREVRALAGVPPAALRARVLPGGAGVDGRSAAVPSVQDAPAGAA